MGKVRHSYAASKPPLQPWVLVEYSGTVLVAHCTCMAGLAETCSHIGAILHWIETAVRIQHSTSCTSKDNQWIMPKSIKEVPYLQLKDIDFSAPKRQKLPSASNDNPTTISTCKIIPPSEDEIQDFFHKLSKERTKSVVLSVTESFSSDFICSMDHLPRVLQGIYKSTYLEKDLPELLSVAESFLHDRVTPQMVDNLTQLTHGQSKSRIWYRYKTGRITASRFRQVLHTDPNQPSLSLLKGICYPESYKFSTQATSWGCEHEKDAIEVYKAQMTSHAGLRISSSGFFVSTEHHFLGASPDALIECECCGAGVVEVKCPLCAEKSSIEEATEKVRNFCLEKSSHDIFQLKHDHPYYFQCQLQMYVTQRGYCDFVVWTSDTLHVERITPDNVLIESALPVTQKFFKHCILPELLGKWYTRSDKHPVNPPVPEEDDGSWCYCKSNKGGNMIACDSELCPIQWLHQECVGISVVPNDKWLCPLCDK